MSNNIFEEKDGYIDLEGMQKKVDEANQKKLKQSQERWEKQQEEYKKQRDEYQELFYKALQSDKEAREQQAMNKLAHEKAHVAMELEKPFEKEGIKMERAKNRDSLYRNLLKGLE